MILTIPLTNKEYDYLINNLLENHENILSKLNFVKREKVVIVCLDELVADNIRELTEDRIDTDCYTEDGFPTEEGWILEHFIDKFYIG
ncbi:hypothetical protein Barb7_02278 [Bacteroidales bacterium Barb7]|nr:hypothetical protein Barb7_02278 [Bacteroidales bacterium Barb7]